MVVLHALEHNPWGTFAVFSTIPIAMAVGIYLRKGGNLVFASIVGFSTDSCCNRFWSAS